MAILVQCIVTLIAGFSIAFASDWKLTLIIICVIPVVGSQNYIQVKFLKGFSEDAKVKIYKFYCEHDCICFKKKMQSIPITFTINEDVQFFRKHGFQK